MDSASNPRVILSILALLAAGACVPRDQGYAPGALVAAPTLRVFVSDLTYAGNLGGTAGADAACASEAQTKGFSGTYKALVADATRHACTTANCTGGRHENLDWVLRAYRTYVAEDGTTEIGATNAAGIFRFPVSNSFGSSSGVSWTGLNSDWTAQSSPCGGWTSSSVAQSAEVGNNLGVGPVVISTGGSPLTCDQLHYLYCVEQ